MKVYWKHCGRYTFLTAVLILLVTVSCTQSGKTRLISYSTLLELSEEDKISTCYIKQVRPDENIVTGQLKEIDRQSGLPVKFKVENELKDIEASDLADRLRHKGVKEIMFSVPVQSDLDTILPLGFIFIAFLGFCFWLWMLIECALKEPSVGNDKVVWILIMLFLNVLGAMIYFIFRRRRRKRELTNNQENRT